MKELIDFLERIIALETERGRALRDVSLFYRCEAVYWETCGDEFPWRCRNGDWLWLQALLVRLIDLDGETSANGVGRRDVPSLRETAAVMAEVEAGRRPAGDLVVAFQDAAAGVFDLARDRLLDHGERTIPVSSGVPTGAASTS
jgi:hypothetical protein